MGMYRNRLLLWAVVLGVACSGEVAFAADENLPQPQQSGGVTWVSGGIGLDQSQALKGTMHGYSLVLTFVGRTHSGNEYLSDVPVNIADASGKTVLGVSSDGPFMLVSLPNGRYTVSATYHGQSQRHTVNVSGTAHTRQTFSWSM